MSGFARTPLKRETMIDYSVQRIKANIAYEGYFRLFYPENSPVNQDSRDTEIEIFCNLVKEDCPYSDPELFHLMRTGKCII
jgi:hypothetical protein